MNREEFYRACDDLEGLPPIAAQNYTFELDWLVRQLPHKARVLQVGSHDGRRALSLLRERQGSTILSGNATNFFESNPIL